ncbi:MAG: WxL domain-containing protein [Clostridiales Family XIII bacterium]|jgi:hypothetical protein|nr:WxL domain-containing protein [Clostridiales Family XIII bacterium]
MGKSLSKGKIRKLLIMSVTAMMLALFVLPGVAIADTTRSTAAEVEFEAGELKLIAAPGFDFGTHTISGTTEDYEAVSIDDSIETEDARGTFAGWVVTVALSNFEDSSNATTLAGSYITLKNLSISASNGTAGDPPVAAGASIKIDCDNSAVDVLVADPTEGAGSYETTIDEADAVLTVLPGTATVDTHSATMSWEITDAP